MSILSELSELCGEAFAQAGADSSVGNVVYSQRPDLCQFQCNDAMPAAKKAGKNPRELADAVAAILAQADEIASVEVAGPGFLNIKVTPEYLQSKIAEAANSEAFGLSPYGDKKVMIDYGGANVAKSLHVGHLRTALIGESLKRTYRLAGFETLGDVHLGDWGLPMGQLVAIMELEQPEMVYFDETYEGDYPTESPVTIQDLEILYPKASSMCKEDSQFAEKAQLATVALQEGRRGYRALWQHFFNVSAEALKETYGSLGVEFDLWLGEASVADRVDAMIKRISKTGVSEESDGALVVNVVQEDDKEDIPPLMLLNSRGGLTYGTTDVATIEERVDDFNVDKVVYIVDNRQSLHFEQVFRTSRLSGIAPDDVELIHAANGTVNGPDGSPLKTRDGNLPRLIDLVAESGDLALEKINEGNLAQDFDVAARTELAKKVGIAALAYGELSNHRLTNYSFDLDRFTNLKGQTGPYLQYVAVRAKSTQAKANEAGISAGNFKTPCHEAETSLILVVLKLQEVVERTIEQNAPNLLAEYAYEVASTFNQFYDQCHILSQESSETQQSWLALVAFTEEMLKQLCFMLCIPVPDRM